MAEPTAENARELLKAALAFAKATRVFGQRCPYCEGAGEEHLLSCRVAELRKKLLPTEKWSEERAKDCPDVRGIVLLVREIVLALDGFDPEFCVLSQSFVNLLKEKLIPFETVK